MTEVRWTVFADRFPLAAPEELGSVMAPTEAGALQLARATYKRKHVFVQRASRGSSEAPPVKLKPSIPFDASRMVRGRGRPRKAPQPMELPLTNPDRKEA